MPEIRKFLRQYIKSVHWDWSLYSTPTRSTISANLQHPKDSAPGKDGVPHRAWACGGQFALEALNKLLISQLSGLPAYPDYNFSLWIFPPEKKRR